MRGIPAWVDTPHAWQPLPRCLPHRLLDAVEPSEIINVYPEAVVFPLIVVQVCPLAQLLASEEAYTKLRHGVLNHGSGHVLLSITLILVFSFERIRIRFFIFRLSGMFRIPCHQVALKKYFWEFVGLLTLPYAVCWTWSSEIFCVSFPQLLLVRVFHRQGLTYWACGGQEIRVQVMIGQLCQ